MKKTMKRIQKIGDKKLSQMKRLYQDGLTYREIADRYGMKLPTVWRYMNKK